MSWWRYALWAAVVAVALVFLWAVRAVILPFIAAWIVAILLEPLVRKLEAKRIPRDLAVVGLIAVFFAGVAGAGLWVGPRVFGQVQELQKQVQSFTATISRETESENHFLRWNPVVRAQAPGPLAAVDRSLERFAPVLDTVGLPSTRRALFDQYIGPQRDQIAEGIAGFFNGFFRLLIGAAQQLFLFIFVPLFVFFFLRDMDRVGPRVISWVPPALRASAAGLLQDVGDVFKSYLRGVLLNITLYTLVFSLVLSVLGLPYAILLGLFAGILYLIPMIGPNVMFFALILIVGLSGASSNWMFDAGSSWTFALIVSGIFIVLSTVYDFGVTPRVVGGSVGLDPLVGMFTVFSGGALFGLPGMIIAYPLAGAIKVTLSRVLQVTNQTAAGEGMSLPAVPVRHRRVSDLP